MCQSHESVKPPRLLKDRLFAQRAGLAQKSSFFILKNTINFADQFHQPFWVLLTGSLFAETQPTLSCFTFHAIKPSAMREYEVAWQ